MSTHMKHILETAFGRAFIAALVFVIGAELIGVVLKFIQITAIARLPH